MNEARESLKDTEAWRLLALKEAEPLADNAAELSVLTGVSLDDAKATISSVLAHGTETGDDYYAGLEKTVHFLIWRLTQPYRYPNMTTRLDLALELLRGDSAIRSVLDYGGGAGQDSIIYAKAGYDTSYADLYDLVLLPFVRKRFEIRQLPVSVLDVASLGNRRFDAISCLDVIEHVYDVEAVVADIASHLRPGGRLVCWPAFFNTWNGDHVEKNCAYNAFFTQMLESVGFRLIFEKRSAALMCFVRERPAGMEVRREVVALKREMYEFSKRASLRVALRGVAKLPFALVRAAMAGGNRTERFARMEPAISRVIDSFAVWRLSTHRLLLKD